MSDRSDAGPTVGELGEAQMLSRILSRIPAAAGVLVGPGDDAAVVAASGPLVVTTDTLVAGPDFRVAWSSGVDLGWKAAAVNLSDVAAMGARPTALVVALAAPPATPASYLEGIAQGFAEACAALAPGCGVVGGDLAASDTLVVAVTALGALDGPAVLRSGAREGDVVAVAGDLGAAGRGLALLFDRFADAEGIALPVRGALDDAARADLQAQLRPAPPIALGVAAAVAGATAMLDVSDGLALDARRLAAASDVTLDLDAAAVVALARRYPGAVVHGDEALLRQALTGGEDHALLATFAADAVPPGFTPIGAVRARGAAPLTVDGVPFEGRGGWDPYRDAR